jgi:PAS domain S-box-containing protein
MKLTNQLLVIGAVNTVVKINGDPWCTSEEVKNMSGLGKRVDCLLEVLIDKGLIEQYKEGYRQSIWINSHDKFVALMNQSDQAMFLVQDLKIKFANRKLFEFIQYTLEEMISRSFIEFVHPKDLDVMSERHLARLRGEKVENSYSFHFVDKDLSVKRVEVDVSNLALWDNKPAMMTLVKEVIAV